MKYVYNNKEYNIEIIRKNNRNTYIRVKNNTIVVTTNYLTPTKIIEKLINNNNEFINNALNKSNKKKEDTSFKLFGNSYDIILGFPNTEINERKIYTKDTKTLNKYLTEHIHNIYLERLTYWHKNFKENIPYPNLKIRKMSTRWGVCNTKNKNVTLNLELSKYPIEILDYVIVHELSHLVHPNHSKSFWETVSKHYPNYKEARKYLKENS